MLLYVPFGFKFDYLANIFNGVALCYATVFTSNLNGLPRLSTYELIGIRGVGMDYTYEHRLVQRLGSFE